MIRHLYAHIPFCHRICPYCGFFKHTPGGYSQPDFVSAMLREAASAAERLPLALETIYLGGGTPSLLATPNLRALLSGLREIAGDTLREFTMEANPMTFDDRKARAIRAEGVTRISLGVQAWDQPTLSVLGRDHSPETARRAWAVLRDAGFPSLNLDLMFSVPGLTLEQWRESLKLSISLSPNHISAYNLTYEEDTEFLEKFKAGGLDADEDRDATQYHLAREMLPSAGFEHYETSNYAQPGHRSLHNAAYWSGADFLGLGPGAVSTHGFVRWTNVKDTARYIAQVTGTGRAESDAEHLTPEDKAVESLGMHLRLRDGFSPSLLELFPGADQRLHHLHTEGWIEPAPEGRLRLVPGKSALVDAVAAYLLG